MMIDGTTSMIAMNVNETANVGNTNNDKMPNTNVVSKSVNGLKIDANNPIMIVSNVLMFNAAIKTKVGITHVKSEIIVIAHQTDEIDLFPKKDLHGIL
jgi:hypothetical protein